MVKIRDTNHIPKLLRELKKLHDRHAEVGVFEDAPGLVAIAEMNEFGIDIRVTDEFSRMLHALADEHGLDKSMLPKAGDVLRIPERSFLRSTFDSEKGKFDKAAREQALQVLTGKADAYEALRELGRQVQKAIIDRVAAGDFKPNDPFTIALKGHDRPLIGETGVLETTQGIRVRVIRK